MEKMETRKVKKMERVKIMEILKTVLYEKIGEMMGIEKEDMTDSMSFEDMGMDSLDFVEVVMEMEKRLNVVIPDDKLDYVTRIGEMADVIYKIVNE